MQETSCRGFRGVPVRVQNIEPLPHEWGTEGIEPEKSEGGGPGVSPDLEIHFTNVN